MGLRYLDKDVYSVIQVARVHLPKVRFTLSLKRR